MTNAYLTKKYYGKELADKIKADVLKKTSELAKKGRSPRLVLLRFTDDTDAIAYEKSIISSNEKLGIEVLTVLFMEDETDSILAKIYELNSDKSINAIMLLMPLRKELDEARIFGAIAKEKDVDSISGYSISEIVGQGIYSTGFLPCTAEAVIRLIKFYSVEISGKSVVVVGRSRVIGLPVSLLFLNENATVTICHSRTENIRDITMQADIVIAAAGQKKMVDVSYIKRGAILIDVGIHTDVSGLTGDVDADSVEGVAGALSPVPGGLGSVTTAILSEHVLRAAEI